MIKDIGELVFEDNMHPQLQRAVYNGYSIVTGELLHNGRLDLYEVMDHDGEVHGYLTDNQVLEMINKE